MKKIITTVGTSVFTNLFDEHNAEDLRQLHEDLKGVPSSEWGQSNIQQDRESLKTEVKRLWQTDKASAEISSLLKIDETYPEEELDVYLIATDTVLSRLAAELIQEWFGENLRVNFNPQTHVILGLSMENATSFKEQGIQGMVQTIIDIKGEEDLKDSAILNISGGYKGLIPIMTIVGQLYDMSICYIYEESEELIEIPRMPLNFDWEIIEQFSSALLKPSDMKPEEGEALTGLQLAIKKGEGYSLTILGGLISQYLDRNPPHFGTQFGFFIEYKLKEYFDGQLGCTKVLHGYKPKKYDKEAPDGDVDIALLDNEGGFTAIEIKPFSLLSQPDSVKDFVNRLKNRTLAMAQQKDLHPRELWLFTYSFQEEKGKKIFPVLDEDQKSLFEEIETEMQGSIPHVVLHCKHILVTRNKVKAGDRIPFKKFMGSSIEEKYISTLFPST